MLLSARYSLWLLALLPMAAAMPQPSPAPAFGYEYLEVYGRGLLDGNDDNHSTSTRPASQTPSTTSAPAPPESTTSSSTPSATSTTPISTSVPSSTPPSSAPPSSTASRHVTTDEDGQLYTETVFVAAPVASASASSTPAAADTSSSGPGTGTFIGVGVAGGIAVLGLAAFIIWKFNQKRFSQLDDDAGDINWPMPKEAELKAPAAPSMMGGTNATSSSIDLTNDPYAVPPLPPQRNMPYHDDPSGSAVFYDPYRGPVPHTFTSPPPSTDGGHNSAYGRGEAIPMSTYPSSNSGRQSPGPNAAYDDPYARSGSPGPNAAYGAGAVDAYGARSRSPGPGMAYDADPYAAGRRSPGPALAYGGPGAAAAAYDPSVRMGTPVGAGPGRVGTPLGAGPGRVGTPVGAGGAYGVDMMRTATPLSYRGPSPAPPIPGGGGGGYGGAQPMHDPYGRYTPNPYGQ